jgi:ABC-2 type transport system permease protein
VPSPLTLLIRVNVLQAWRRLKSIRARSGLLTAVVAVFFAGYLAFSFWLFYKGLNFVRSFPGLGPVLIERLLFLLFAFLFVLLLLSNLVISYSNLFRNRESSFLLSLPVRRETIFQWKFLESTVLASWAFVLLMAPLLAAYGLNQRQSWQFYVITLALLGLFIVLPAIAGAWLAINLARYLDRRALQVTLVFLALAAVAGAAWWLQPEPITDEMLETRVLAVLDRLLLKTRFALWPFLPSYWLASGVVHLGEGAMARATFFGMVLLSHALFFGSTAVTLLGNQFYAAASAVQSRSSVFGRWKWFKSRQKNRPRLQAAHGPVEFLVGLLFWLPSDIRGLLVKDIRIFWRDTTQWSQTLVLFGLLGVYIINLRHFSHQLTHPFWLDLIAYLNLGACALNLATLTTRFVYPQFSIEGKRLWIVGLAPLGLHRLVKIKFVLASAASLSITVSLIWLTCQMLGMAWERTLYFTLAVAVMTFTLNGLAAGLGALYPNFKEDNPSKIVSGFGGTFCLVLSFLYIVASIALLAWGAPWGLAGVLAGMFALGWTGAAWTAFILISLLCGWLPMRLALRRVASFEL